MKSKQQRREEGDQRNTAYQRLTTQQKIDQLPATGAMKQRQRLNVRLAQEVKG